VPRTSNENNEQKHEHNENCTCILILGYFFAKTQKLILCRCCKYSATTSEYTLSRNQVNRWLAYFLK